MTQSEHGIHVLFENSLITQVFKKAYSEEDFFELTNIKQEYKENKELLEDTVIEFRKDMTFTFTFIVDLDGTWKLENNKITTTDRRGENIWTIHKITEKEITMSRNEAEQKVIFKAN